MTEGENVSENLVASHLLKWVQYEQDAMGRDLDLLYFRDTDGREMDFVVTENLQPKLLVEVKWQETRIDKTLKYLKVRFPEAEAWQIHAQGEGEFRSPDGIRGAPVHTFLQRLL